MTENFYWKTKCRKQIDMLRETKIKNAYQTKHLQREQYATLNILQLSFNIEIIFVTRNHLSIEKNITHAKTHTGKVHTHTYERTQIDRLFDTQK